jgi:hypothetical protein
MLPSVVREGTTIKLADFLVAKKILKTVGDSEASSPCFTYVDRYG